MPPDATPKPHPAGRIAAWVTLALMLASILYTLVIGIVNWSEIMV